MLNLSVLLPMAVETVKDPQGVAGRLIRLDLPRDVLWQALALVVVMSILLAEVGGLLLTGAPGEATPAFFASPLRMGLVQLCLLVVTVFAIFWIGRAFGGTARLRDALVLIVWLQYMMVCLQVVQTVAILVLPILAWLIGVFALVLFLWLLTHFIAAAHGFTSHAKVFLMILATSFGFVFGLSLILAAIGVSVTGVE